MLRSDLALDWQLAGLDVCLNSLVAGSGQEDLPRGLLLCELVVQHTVCEPKHPQLNIW